MMARVGGYTGLEQPLPHTHDTFNNLTIFPNSDIPVLAMASATELHSPVTNNTTVTDDPTLKAIQHSHWAEFSAQPYSTHLAIGITMSIMGFVAITTNTFVMFVFLRFRSLRTPGNLLVVNLAFSDSMLALLGFPLYAASSFIGHWSFGKIGCNFYGFSGASFGLMSINTMAAIAVDRYLVIVRPYMSIRRISYSQAYIMLGIVWVNAIGWSVPPLVGWSRYILEGLGTTCTFDYLSRDPVTRTYLVSLYVGGFVIPVLLIVYCYTYIFLRVRQHEKAFARTSKRMKTRYIRGAKEATRRADVKTARTGFLAVIVFCIAWSPYAVMALVGQFGDQDLLTPIVSAIPGILAKSSTIYNPMIFAVSHPRFRRKLRYLYFATIGKGANTDDTDICRTSRQDTRVAAAQSRASDNQEKKLETETFFCQSSRSSFTRTVVTDGSSYGTILNRQEAMQSISQEHSYTGGSNSHDTVIFRSTNEEYIEMQRVQPM
uniref:Rhabdomeric opsin 4 n=1 Tax=Platynereis dumerilii TaxID=6359 RepID=R4S0M6_PLADU|nr:rhabdomeric opsin 4 [Platynereis dumerilii]